MGTRRIYCETLPFAKVVERRTLDLLARYRLEIVLAVRPPDLGALADVARALAGAGVSLSIWPMLADADDRWANVYNADEFGDLVLATCDVLAAAGHPPRDVLLDLEPGISRGDSLADVDAERATLAAMARNVVFRRPKSYDLGARLLARTVAAVRARGIGTSLAVWPLVALDASARPAWQSLLETPVDPLGADHVSIMTYTSIFEGWSHGLVRRRDATALLHAAARRAVGRWGGRAGVSLGCVGTGAFENEPTYRDPAELAEDVAAARAAGCDDLTLFDLGGVLSRVEPPEAWLDAFHGSGGGRTFTTARVRAAGWAARSATWALGRCTLRTR